MNDKNDLRVRCDECEQTIVKTLVETDSGFDVKLACGCHVFERTKGRHVPFTNDIPDKWSKASVEPPWRSSE